MKTQTEVLNALLNGRKSQCIDGRDYDRLLYYFDPREDDVIKAFKLNPEAAKKWEGEDALPWTQEQILEDLERDIEFAFEKALDERGISSSLMYEVIKMWMWVLNDDLQYFDSYNSYGLPFFKAVAKHFEFNDPTK